MDRHVGRTAPIIAIETADGWVRLAGSRFVGPKEYREQLSGDVARMLGLSELADQTLLDALATAADDAGLLIGFEPDEFYRRHVSKVLREDDDPIDWTLRSDRFIAMVLTDMRLRYLACGLLAQRGATADCRLTLPADVPPPVPSSGRG